MTSEIPVRFHCPCCGYPTLPSQGHFDICHICWWEDDGQNDADKVVGGPNGDYSLTAARHNFAKYGIKYSPENDTRFRSDSPEILRLRDELIHAYDLMRSLQEFPERSSSWEQILRLEDMLNVAYAKNFDAR
ncbi:CPCC family cysteine-rich protein [Leptospira weilii]|uniref:CPCC family cysteine-rich protein n=1 Tax=Leptospira weilii TaxID=28184 RepID=UPI00055CFDAC|nr:CPCC family cysteine-rich protein [Leptospira weilii]